jgi:hypothetical protein
MLIVWLGYLQLSASYWSWILTFCQEISLVCYQSILNNTEETKVAGPSGPRISTGPAARSLFSLTGPTVNILATGQRLRRPLRMEYINVQLSILVNVSCRVVKCLLSILPMPILVFQFKVDWLHIMLPSL